MLRQAVLTTLVLGVCVLAGCKSDCPCNQSGGDMQVVAAPSEKAPVSESAASPGHYRRQLTERAMHGLSYETGRVIVQEDVAQTLPERGDASAAADASESGWAHLRANDRIAALESFTRAVMIAPGRAETYVGLGTALVWKGKLDEAIAAFRTGLDLDAADVELRAKLADALERRGDLDAAVDAYRDVLALEPDHERSLKRLAIAYYYRNEDVAAWKHVHALEAQGGTVPPQFRSLLAERTPEPRR